MHADAHGFDLKNPRSSVCIRIPNPPHPRHPSENSQELLVARSAATLTTNSNGKTALP
jgi:hypothetical protein